MQKAFRSKIIRYGGATGAVVLAGVVRWMLDPVLGEKKPLATFLPAVMFTAWAFGSGPTLLSLFLSVGVAAFFFLPPRDSFWVQGPADQVGLLIFTVFGLFTALLSEQLYRARERGEWQQLQRESDHALLESERRFRQLADTMPQMVWTIGPDGQADYYNERWYEYTGLPREPRGDKGWASAVHPDDIEWSKAAWLEAVESGRLFQNVFRVKDSRTGAYRWHLGRAVPARDEAGQIVQWYGTSTDIDDQKRIEEKLRESERLYRAIGESIDYGVWVCDPEGKNIYTSPSFLHLVGLTQEQCAEFGWKDVLHPDDAERTIAAWKECVRVRGKWDMEHRFRGVDGQWHTILARGAPVEDEEGRLLCWAGINLDIGRLKNAELALQHARDELEQRVRERTLELTEANQSLSREVEERRAVEARLRESEQRFQAFMDHLPAGAWILDDQSRCLYVNQFYGTMTGVDPTSIIGRTAYDLYPDEIAAQYQANDRLVLEAGKGLELAESFVRADGTPGDLLVVKFPMRERDNQLRIGGVAIDVTERKLAEDRMRRLAAQLATAEDTERHRLATDLHDSIGQSLSLLKLNLEPWAAHGVDNPRFAHALTTSLQLLDDIIKQTRTLMFDLYPSILHDLGLVPTLLWYSEKLSAQAQVTVSEIGKAQMLPVPVASYLFRATKELLGNAVRHGRAQEIIVAVHWRCDALKIVIDDDGCGFDPVKDLAPRTQRGLGLAGIQERLVSFSGKMFIESTPNQGTRIAMEVPLNHGPHTDGI